MKKLILFAGSAILLFGCSEKPGYQISGVVSDSTLDGQYVFLYPYGDKEATPLDSALVEKGTFALKGVQETPVLRTLRFSNEVVEPARVPAGENSPYSAVFTLENAKLNVTLDEKSSVTGTPVNDSYVAFQQEVRRLNDEMEQIGEGTDSEDPAVLAAAEAKYNEISDKVAGVAKAFVGSNANQLIAAKSLLDFRYQLSEIDQNEIIAKSDSVFKSFPGVDNLMAHLEVLKSVAVGKPFVDFDMADLKGEVKKLSDYVGQGKYVLIDFWASWCPPCRREMPNLVAAYKKYKAKGFEIVGVSLDSDKAAWEKGIKDLEITWPQLSDLKGWKNEGAALYGINLIPQTYLIDREGTIIAKNLSTEELNKKLEELFK